MYELAFVITDENLDMILISEDFLYLEASRVTNQVGAISALLPMRYEPLLREAGLIQTLENALNTVPCFWCYVMMRQKNCDWFVLGCTTYLITRPALRLEENSEEFIVISGLDAAHMLNARSIPRVEDDADPLVTKVGPTATIMHEIFEEQFGPVGATIAGTNYPRRDWITPGVGLGFAAVADGPAITGPGAAGFEPRLNVRGTLLDIMQEGADYSIAQGTPLFFDMVPTKTCSRAGERPIYPIEFTTWIDQRGEDRSEGNAAGNAPVTLSPQRGNVGEFEIGAQYQDDFTVAWGFGESTGAARPRTDACVSDIRINSCIELGWWESIATDNQAAEQAEVQTLCESHLEDGRSRGEITAKILQTSSFRFGKVGTDTCPDGSILNYCGDADFGDKITLSEERKDRTPFSVDVWITGFRLQAEDKQCNLELRLSVTNTD